MYSLGSGRSVTKSRPPAVGRRLLLLTLVLFVFHSVDFANLAVAPAAQRAPFTLLMVAVLHAAVVSVLISGARWHGRPLALTVFLFFFGVGSVLPGLDAVFGSASGGVWSGLLNGFIVAGVIALVGVRAFDKWQRTDGSAGTAPLAAWSADIPKVLGQAVLLALGWTLIDFLFRSVWGSGASSTTGDALLYQTVRGVIWVLLTVPVVRGLRGDRSQIALLIGLFYALLLGAPLLLPADVSAAISSADRTPLLIQVVGSSTLFGWLAGWLLWEPADQ